MTVIEVMPPAVRPDTEREERARILEAAALEIEVRGWCQRAITDKTGAACALGAIAFADGWEGWGSGRMPDEFLTTRRGFQFTMLLVPFNNAPGRTATEVTFALRWRAEEIRDGWDA